MAERRRHSPFKRQLDMLDGRSIFINTEWADWLRDQKNKIQSVSLTIMEHKKYFLNKRPEWAKTFSEKEISDDVLVKESDKYFKHLLRLDPEEWSIEREIIDDDEKEGFIVERILNRFGDCRYVTTIFPNKEGNHTCRLESWFAKGQWTVGQECTYNRRAGFYTEKELLNHTETWFRVFK